MTRFFRLTATGLFAFSLAGIAQANPADIDKDGRISKAEFMNAANERFDSADTNGDALISVEERNAHQQFRQENRQDQRFDRLDVNGDGVISKSEYEGHMEKARQRQQDRRDVNGDGQVDQADRAVFREKMRERRAQRRDRRGENRPARIRPDANNDGFISRAEQEAATEALFDRLDVNGDGYLEKGEGRRKHKRKRRRR